MIESVFTCENCGLSGMNYEVLRSHLGSEHKMGTEEVLDVNSRAIPQKRFTGGVWQHSIPGRDGMISVIQHCTIRE